MTALWSSSDLIEATGGTMLTAFAASGVSIDTRTLVPGDLFVALQGETGDGHAFVADALAKGAAGAMVHRDVVNIDRVDTNEIYVDRIDIDGVHVDRVDIDQAQHTNAQPEITHISTGRPIAARLLRVDDTLAALTRLGAYGRARFAGRVVAITGSVGKTTTKEMLRRILAAFGPTHAAVASYNNHWGVPLTLARLPPDARFCVAEIGMNHAGEIAPLARLARPHIAVITSIEKAHVGHLGSIAAIAEEKASILRGLQPDGVAVLPLDSPLFSMLRATAEATGDGGMRIATFGVNPAADACLLAAEADADGTNLTVRVNGTEARLRIDAPGRHMAMNALAALAAAASLGADVRNAAEALNGFAPVAGRGARRDIVVANRRGRDGTAPNGTTPNGTTPNGTGPNTPTTGKARLLDESYNGNGASMRAALAVLRLQPGRRRLAVLGDMLELGDEGPAEHLALADAVTEAADLLFACGPLMRALCDAVPERLHAVHAPDSAALAEIVADSVRPGDTILVKGSLGSRMKRVVEALDTPGSGG
jgi:UDP-N-acetylmuramoyl-tripeptide--D-alanyl-D-alanine ligase